MYRKTKMIFNLLQRKSCNNKKKDEEKASGPGNSICYRDKLKSPLQVIQI